MPEKKNSKERKASSHARLGFTSSKQTQIKSSLSRLGGTHRPAGFDFNSVKVNF